MKNENKKDFVFVENMDFDEEHIKEIGDLFAVEALEILTEQKDTVLANINYLKNLGVSNYQDAFLRFYNMFLMEPSSFEEIFSKYDKEDLIAKLEKNIAIMEHL